MQDSDINPIFKMFSKISSNIDKEHRDNKETVLALLTDYILANEFEGYANYLYKNDDNLNHFDIDENHPLVNNIKNMSVKFA